MKNCFSILLLISVVTLSLGRQGSVLATFKVFQDYVAQNLCENRDRPITMCYGSCVLEKELEKSQEESESAGSDHEETITFQAIQHTKKESNPYFIADKDIQEGYRPNLYHFLTESGLFRPPLS